MSEEAGSRAASNQVNDLPGTHRSPVPAAAQGDEVLWIP